MQHRAPATQKDLMQSLNEQAGLYSKKLIKIASRESRIAEDHKEIVKTIKQLNQLIDQSAAPLI